MYVYAYDRVLLSNYGNNLKVRLRVLCGISIVSVPIHNITISRLIDSENYYRRLTCLFPVDENVNIDNIGNCAA